LELKVLTKLKQYMSPDEIIEWISKWQGEVDAKGKSLSSQNQQVYGGIDLATRKNTEKSRMTVPDAILLQMAQTNKKRKDVEGIGEVSNAAEEHVKETNTEYRVDDAAQEHRAQNHQSVRNEERS